MSACGEHICETTRCDCAFELRNGEFVQRVGSELPELEFVDFTGGVDPEAACRRWIDEAGESVLPLDGPLTRVAVLVDRTDSFVVYVCFHHAVGDGWSFNLAMSQLFYEYVSEVFDGSDNDVQVPSYLDFVCAEREYHGSPEWVADREYFVGNTATSSPRCSPAADRCVAVIGSVTPCGLTPEELNVFEIPVNLSSRSLLPRSASTCAEYTAAGTSSSAFRS